MIAPYDPHAPSATVMAGDGGVFPGRWTEKKNLGDFKVLEHYAGWPSERLAHFSEIRLLFGKKTEPRPRCRKPEGARGGAASANFFLSVTRRQVGVSLATTRLSTRAAVMAGRVDGRFRTISKGMTLIPFDACAFLGRPGADPSMPPSATARDWCSRPAYSR